MALWPDNLSEQNALRGGDKPAFAYSAFADSVLILALTLAWVGIVVVTIGAGLFFIRQDWGNLIRAVGTGFGLLVQLIVLERVLDLSKR